ncbi:MAG: SPFH/Band 7/PHB domain protein [Armatimonadetes bacterium]|nr:SPFH/Band 7/PHB domain protein [Armatimonadota bacterium]
MEGLIAIFVALVVGIFLLSTIRRSMTWIRPFQRGLHERFGRFMETLEPGFYFIPKIIPFIDVVVTMDLREFFVEIPEARVITRDNVVLEVDCIVFYQVVEASKAFYEVNNLDGAVVNLAEPGLRNVIGTFTVDEALASREIINTRLRDDMDRYTDKWGTRVTKVEVKRIDPPKDIQEAMHKEKTAEQIRRAVVIEAEGQKAAAINVAEGRKQSAILEAEGQMQAQIDLAEGQSKAITLVLDALHNGKVDEEVLNYIFVKDTLPKMFTSESNKWILNFDLPDILNKVKALASPKD